MGVCVCFRRLSPFPVTILTNWVCRLSFLSTVEWNVDGGGTAISFSMDIPGVTVLVCSYVKTLIRPIHSLSSNQPRQKAMFFPVSKELQMNCPENR